MPADPPPLPSNQAPPLIIDVQRVGADRVALSWTDGERVPGASVRVELATGEPDGPAVQTTVVAASSGLAVFDGVADFPRSWFRLSFGPGPHILAAERRLRVTGTLNFRDLGGYPAGAGHRVRWGRVFRSDNFAEVPADAWRQLHAMGLREVFDLRHPAERERSPSVIPDDLDIATSVLAIGGEAAEAPDLVDLLSSGSRDSYGLEFMMEMYQKLVVEHGATFARLLSHLAEPERLPAVFHCTAGKDRTGVAAALLLEVLGVERGLVLDDYELSTRYRSGPRIEQLRPRLVAAGVDIESVRPFLSAPRPALTAALAEVDEHHGSVIGFLRTCGLDPEVPDRLRAALVEPMPGGAGSVDDAHVSQREDRR
jgi:protein-tyrosine phosphatase